MAAESAPVSYYLLLLDEEKSKKSINWMWPAVLEQEGDWIAADTLNYELQTYDPGRSRIIYEDDMYILEIDYIDASKERRIFVGRHISSPETKVKKPVPEEEAGAAPGKD